MKNIVFIITLFVSSLFYGQDAGVIEGIVKDLSNGNDPMMFATVSIKETKQSITTGFRGGYFFKDLKPGKYTLTFNFLGYKTLVKEVEVKEEKEEKIVVDAKMEPTTDINFEAIQLTSN